MIWLLRPLREDNSFAERIEEVGDWCYYERDKEGFKNEVMKGQNRRSISSYRKEGKANMSNHARSFSGMQIDRNLLTLLTR